MNTQEEKKIHLSETCEKKMKRSILYLQIGFYSAVVFVIMYIYEVIVEPTISIPVVLLFSVLFSVLCIIGIVKMHAYIEAYRKLKANKTQQTLGDWFSAQRKYYVFLYIVPLVILALTLIIYQSLNNYYATIF